MIRPSGLPNGIPRGSAVTTLIVLILVHVVVAWAIGLFPRLIAVDFYHYWSVSAARRFGGEAVGFPYGNGRAFQALLQLHAEQSDQPKLRAAQQRMKPSFTATPLLYMLFGAFPADYARAVALFQTLQVLLFLAGVLLLGMVYRYPASPSICLALVLLLGSGPVFADLRVGNLGCLQFFSLAGLLALADRLRRAPRATPGAIVLTGVTLVALIKPNVALVAPVMAIHLGLVYGRRFLAVAAVPAALFGAAAIVMSSVHFRSWTVWYEWYGVVYGRHPYMLANIPPASGNYALSSMLARWIHADVWIVVAGLTAILSLSVIAVMVVSATARGRVSTLPRSVLERVFGDAQLAMAIAITLTIAVAPMFWYHYGVVALIPGLWLLNASARSPGIPLCGLAALVLSSGLLNPLFLPLDLKGAAEIGAALSWVFLWGGILLWLSPGDPDGFARSR